MSIELKQARSVAKGDVRNGPFVSARLSEQICHGRGAGQARVLVGLGRAEHGPVRQEWRADTGDPVSSGNQPVVRDALQRTDDPRGGA